MNAYSATTITVSTEVEADTKIDKGNTTRYLGLAIGQVLKVWHKLGLVPRVAELIDEIITVSLGSVINACQTQTNTHMHNSIANNIQKDGLLVE